MLRRLVCLGLLTGLTAGCGKEPSASATSPTPVAPMQVIVEQGRGLIALRDAVHGQSVTIAGGAYRDIRFTWLGPPNAIPLRGSVYILAEEYLGRISGLSASTPGFVARSERLEDRDYVFESAVTLRAGKYWFLNDSDTTVYITPSSTDGYGGGDFYLAGQREFDRQFVKYSFPGEITDANFRLSGRPTAVPASQ